MNKIKSYAINRKVTLTMCLSRVKPQVSNDVIRHITTYLNPYDIYDKKKILELIRETEYVGTDNEFYKASASKFTKKELLDIFDHSWSRNPHHKTRAVLLRNIHWQIWFSTKIFPRLFPEYEDGGTEGS